MSSEVITPTTPLEYALKYAQLGLAVLPIHGIIDGLCSCGKPGCPNPGKHPMTSHGVKDATTDFTQIRDWWHRWPWANIAVQTGLENNTCVLDIDPRNGGAESFEKLLKEVPELTEFQRTETSGGGFHVYFSYPENGIKNITGLGNYPGIDIKGSQGYVVAPPSNHASGEKYRFPSNGFFDVPFKPIPQSLLTIMREGGRKKNSLLPTGLIFEGERNNSLFRIACKMTREGDDRDAVYKSLSEINQTQCSPPISKNELAQIVDSAQKNRPNLEEEWDDPIELPHLSPVPPFDPENVPEPMRDWVIDVSERMQCPLDYAVISAVMLVSAVTGSRVVVRPKAFDNWELPANLWGYLAGNPGQKKSHVVNEIFKPLYALEAEAKESFEKQLSETKNRANKLEEEIKQIGKAQRGRTAIRRNTLMDQLNATKDEEKKLEKNRTRYIAHDCTQEKLGEILAANPKGIVLLRDELAGLLHDLEKKGHESDREFLLQGWSGLLSHSCDRIGRGSIYISPLCLSVFGTIQPEKLVKVLKGTINDGLAQRFQMISFPDEGDFVYSDSPPNEYASLRMEKIIRTIAHCDFEQFGATRLHETGRLGFRFDAEAQPAFVKWLTENEMNTRNPDEDLVVREHFAKFSKLMPALALLFHLIEITDGKVRGNINLACTNMAIAWTKYLAAHARRIYTLANPSRYEAARKLKNLILSGKIKSAFRISQICKNEWALLRTPDEVREACHILEQYNYVRGKGSERNGKGGRPTTNYSINPKLVKK